MLSVMYGVLAMMPTTFALRLRARITPLSGAGYVRCHASDRNAVLNQKGT